MHIYTTLPAPAHLVDAGFSVVVAKESDRIPLAAFKEGDEASAWCEGKNKPASKVIELGVSQTLKPEGKASVTK